MSIVARSAHCSKQIAEHGEAGVEGVLRERRIADDDAVAGRAPVVIGAIIAINAWNLVGVGLAMAPQVEVSEAVA